MAGAVRTLCGRRGSELRRQRSLPALRSKRRRCLLAACAAVACLPQASASCPTQPEIHASVQSVCCAGSLASGCAAAEDGLPGVCTADCAVHLEDWWNRCYVMIGSADGYAEFHARCLEVYPASCRLLTDPPMNGSLGSCTFNATMEHSRSCAFECDEGFGIVGAQPECNYGAPPPPPPPPLSRNS